MFCRHGGDGPPTVQKQQIEFTSPAWLHSSGWDRSLHTVLIVHGYGGATQDFLPAPVLRDGECIYSVDVVTTTATIDIHRRDWDQTEKDLVQEPKTFEILEPEPEPLNKIINYRNRAKNQKVSVPGIVTDVMLR